MSFEQIAEQPRHTIVSVRASPVAELTRWLFELSRVAYHDEPHAPLFATRRGTRELPAVVGPEGAWAGARAILDGLDAKSRPGQRLYGEGVERGANLTLVERLLELLPEAMRACLYGHLLASQRVLFSVVTDGAPPWERAFVLLLYPLWRRLMTGRLGLTPDGIAAAADKIRAACDTVEAELARRGTAFIGGTHPGIVDIVFAALLAPLVLPPQHGAKLPALDALPDALKNLVAEMRARRAGQLVLATYETARPQPQAPMAARGNGRPLTSIILEAWPQRLAAKAAAAFGRVIRIKQFVLAIRWDDVEDVLRRDLDFILAPVNGPRIDEVNGPFVLGIDRGQRMGTERPQLYHAVAAIDLGSVRALVAREAEKILDHAVATNGRLDVVNGYARLVAARTARHVFGLPGPTEMDLMRVIRAIFQHTFLNLFGDEDVRQRAVHAAGELTRWFLDEIERRHRAGITGDDVIGRLLALRQNYPDALDDDGVRRNVAGLLVGSIDTTATAVAKIVSMAADGGVLARLACDIDDPQRLTGWCNELLRMWTHNPILLRQAATDTAVGGKTVPAGSTVVAFTQAAMFDKDRFANPWRLDPTRSPKLYRHFGGGLHPCAGRAVNEVQIPELVRLIVRRGIARVERPRYDGPFIDELVISFGSRP